MDLKASTILMEECKSNRKPEPTVVPILATWLSNRNAAAKQRLSIRASAKLIRYFREGWNLVCERAGNPDLLFHDLHRTALRNLRRAGVPETVVMKITSHRIRSVFEQLT